MPLCRRPAGCSASVGRGTAARSLHLPRAALSPTDTAPRSCAARSIPAAPPPALFRALFRAPSSRQAPGSAAASSKAPLFCIHIAGAMHGLSPALRALTAVARSPPHASHSRAHRTDTLTARALSTAPRRRACASFPRRALPPPPAAPAPRARSLHGVAARSPPRSPRARSRLLLAAARALSTLSTVPHHGAQTTTSLPCRALPPPALQVWSAARSLRAASWHGVPLARAGGAGGGSYCRHDPSPGEAPP